MTSASHSVCLPVRTLVTLSVMMVTVVTMAGATAAGHHIKCCPAGEALVRSGDGREPSCTTVPLDPGELHRLYRRLWRKHLERPKNEPGESYEERHHRHSNHLSDPSLPLSPPPPPGYANLTCAHGHFWLTSRFLDGGFSLLPNGELQRGSARYPSGGHCSDLLLAGGRGNPRPSLAARVCHLPLIGRTGRVTVADAAERCGSGRCLRKCCPPGMLIRRSRLTCVPAAAEWTPAFYRSETPLPDSADLRVVSGVPACAGPDGQSRGVFALDPDRPPLVMSHAVAEGRDATVEAQGPHPDRFFIQEDGRLWAPGQAMIPAGEFCVDSVLYGEESAPRRAAEEAAGSEDANGPGEDEDEEEGTRRRRHQRRVEAQWDDRRRRHQRRVGARSHGRHEHRRRRGGRASPEPAAAPSVPLDSHRRTSIDSARARHMAVLCYPAAPPPPADPARRAGPPPLLTALQACSAAGLLGVLLVHVLVPALRNQHGRCLVSHAAALLVALACLMTSSRHAVYSRAAVCQGVALLMHYSFLASCFWLNVMSFDIWLTFSRLRAAPSRAGQQRARFVRYSVYAWCSPLLLTLLTALAQFAPDGLAPLPPPGLGARNCWFPGSLEMLIYFHWPILVLMTANLIFFLVTACNVRKGEKNAERVRKQKCGTERFKIYVHLFIVMGVSWIAEGLSKHFGPSNFWLAADLFNSLQGALIFLLLALRGGTRRALRRQAALWWRRAAQRSLSSSSGRRSRSTSASSRHTAPTSLSARHSNPASLSARHSNTTSASARHTVHALLTACHSAPTSVTRRHSPASVRHSVPTSALAGRQSISVFLRWRSRSTGPEQGAPVAAHRAGSEQMSLRAAENRMRLEHRKEGEARTGPRSFLAAERDGLATEACIGKTEACDSHRHSSGSDGSEGGSVKSNDGSGDRTDDRRLGIGDGAYGASGDDKYVDSNRRSNGSDPASVGSNGGAAEESEDRVVRVGYVSDGSEKTSGSLSSATNNASSLCNQTDTVRSISNCVDKNESVLSVSDEREKVLRECEVSVRICDEPDTISVRFVNECLRDTSTTDGRGSVSPISRRTSGGSDREQGESDVTRAEPDGDSAGRTANRLSSNDSSHTGMGLNRMSPVSLGDCGSGGSEWELRCLPDRGSVRSVLVRSPTPDGRPGTDV